MTAKKVAFGGKPSNKPARASAEQWVQSRADGEGESMKRLTLDVPESLHRRIKVACAARGTKMAEELRALLEAHYAEK
jgi:hypothetical protein